MSKHFRAMTSSNAVVTILSTLLLATATGCASLKADVPFDYTPSLRAGEPIEGKAVLELIEDVRSKSDRRTTREITDCAGKLTAKLVDDFRSTRLFGDVDYSAGQTEAEFIINGKLEEFSWKHRSEIGAFIALAAYFGAPLQTFTGKARLTLEVRDGLTGRGLGRYTGSAKNKTTYNIYEIKGVEMGVELQYALRDAVKQIKDQMTNDPRLRGRPASEVGP